jgi:hypothetical protein
VACNSEKKAESGNDVLSQGSFVLSKAALQNKIKGGWAGQTIGVVYGAPVEFKYQGSLIDDQLNIPWNEHYVKYWWDKKPGLFDDIYTDLNFVKAFEKHGLNASSDSIAHHWSNTAYHLAHANQASRYNILNGIMPPASGFWKNNPHADDIDFQIEADFIGLMAPGMVNAATEIADRVGHVMNSGDGWYGGVFVSAMYSLAFVSMIRCISLSRLFKQFLQEPNFMIVLPMLLSGISSTPTIGSKPGLKFRKNGTSMWVVRRAHSWVLILMQRSTPRT